MHQENSDGEFTDVSSFLATVVFCLGCVSEQEIFTSTVCDFFSVNSYKVMSLLTPKLLPLRYFYCGI